MPVYENYENKICQASISEDGDFYLLDPDKILIKDPGLRACFKREIDFWELGSPGIFYIVYSIQDRGDHETHFVGHEHEFERVKSNIDVPKKKKQQQFNHHFETIENFHECKVCGFIYELEIKKFL